jgi:asparagine synthase (glutamine-hydrolysing)
MCGLVGVASVVPQSARNWLALGRDAMLHRGPDGAGEWWSSHGQVGLGHRRLSVIDLTSAGHQPMMEAKRGLTIVFNGEIYNYRELKHELEQSGHTFRSSSDTEVLLAAYEVWGTDCLSHLNGMFAFAIYDAQNELLFIARDRAGEKPLFYYLSGKTIYFASELKALLANPDLPRRINPESLDCYLSMGFVPGERCMLEGFNKLPPAHALSFDIKRGTHRVWRYWQLPELSKDASSGNVDESALLETLEVLLETAVSKQMVADVPVGVLLSGGVDSSLITAMAVRTSSQVKTFTVGFPGHGSLDETQHARLIADHFGTEHIELQAQAVTAELLHKLARQYDEPIVDSSMIPTYLVSQLVRQHCTVALGGDGGDELFGGYGHYSRLLWMQSRFGQVPLQARKAIAWSAQKFLPQGFKGRNWLQGLGVDFTKDLPLIANYFDKSVRNKLLPKLTGLTVRAEQIFSGRAEHHSDLLERATRTDFKNYLAEDILVKVDRASMINSLEIRAPFLDVLLIEFAYGCVPSNMKATHSDKKILLKQLTARILPKEFDRQRKQGFSIPLASWLKAGPFRDLFQQVLLGPDCMFDRKMISQLLAGQDQGRNNSERLFSLVIFELWRAEYKIAA